jgi:release factor glutamine methyltransferase
VTAASPSREQAGKPGQPDPLTAVAATLRAAGCVFAEDEARLLIETAATPADLDAMVRRRAAGLPLEQVLGWAEFCGRRIVVDPGVFVPRRRTEFLVGQAAALLRDPAPATLPGATVVVDLCCGTGAIGAALAALAQLDGRPIELHATDIDPAAVRCARKNIGPSGGNVYQGDLFGPLPARLRGRICVLISNAPYVPTAELTLMPPEARDHEPRVALDGGGDGLDIVRRIAADAAHWLAPGGHWLVETSNRQANLAAGIMRDCGLDPSLARSPDFGVTVVLGANFD